MKQWIEKLLAQFEIEDSTPNKSPKKLEMSEDRATLLYILDILNKHLIETDAHPLRKTRSNLDEYAKQIVTADSESIDRVLFRLRQFYAGYRIDEYTFIQKTFEDFKSIIWDFADQLAEDSNFERREDSEMKHSLDELREAVEANSIDVLRTKSREFIDHYVEHHTRKDERRIRKLDAMQSNLRNVKRQLFAANHTMRTDHLTGAFNRKSFDEQAKNYWRMFEISQNSVTLMYVDIDHFKKVNDTYGHDVGDFVIQECVRVLKEQFPRQQDFVARIGGEEFAILLPDYKTEHAVKKAEDTLNRIRREVFIQNGEQIRFTVSIGIAELFNGDTLDSWIKRADEALYHSKNNGRNQATVSPQTVSPQIANGSTPKTSVASPQSKLSSIKRAKAS